jgi:ferric-dicitrate binding protein FerR (iron transport regulator)
MHIDDLADLLDRYRLDKCTPAEKRVVEEWYESLRAHPPLPQENDIQASLDKVSARLEEQIGSPDVVWIGSRTYKPYKRALVAAAGILLILGCWKFWWSSGKCAMPNAGTTADSIWVATSAGETKKVVLPDGTLVQLNAGTHFGYPSAFGAERKVRLLTGEAFFQVAPDPQRPFEVLASQTQTKVLGTSFNIRAYERDHGAYIALVSGKVSVSIPNASAPITLTPHFRLSYDSTNNSYGTDHFDKESEVAAWRQRAMNFQDADFDEIAFQLKNMYNIDLVNESSRKHWSYTGYFASENVWEIVKTICITENLSYNFDQNRIIIINKK